MNIFSRFGRYVRNAVAASRLRRKARRTADPSARAELLLESAARDELPGTWMELAVALAQAGRTRDAAEAWLAAIRLKPILIPEKKDMATLLPLLEHIAQPVLDGLCRGKPGFMEYHWQLERRGRDGSEERWKLVQESIWEMEDLMPTLRFIAAAVAHTAPAPGRVRIDCDRFSRDDDGPELLQMGEAVFAWDEARVVDAGHVLM